MVSVVIDEHTKHSECETCCVETTTVKTAVEEWDEQTDDWTMIWLCWHCMTAIKTCSFCAKPTINKTGYYHRETVQILRATGNTVCEDCCEHVMAATTATYGASVDTRPGHWKSSKMSDEEYETAWHELIYQWAEKEWTTYEVQACHMLYDEELSDFVINEQVNPEIEVADEFYEKYDRQQGKMSVKGTQSPKNKKGNKKLRKVGKPITTDDPVAFKAIKNYAKSCMSSQEVIPATPRAAINRMDIPDGAFSDLDMEMEIRTVWALDQPTTMTVAVPVPTCLLKRREILTATEFGQLMVAVWKAYRGHLDRFVDWSDRHIFYFRMSNLISDFTARSQ